MEPNRRHGMRLMIALAVPACVAGTALLILAVYLLVKGMQPGASQTDSRPVSQVTAGIEALSLGTMLLWFARGATGAKAARWSCVAAATVAACLALVLVRSGSQMEHFNVALAAMVLFIYLAAIAGVRLLARPRGRTRSLPVRQTPLLSSTLTSKGSGEVGAPTTVRGTYKPSDPEDVVPPLDLFAVVVLALMAVVVTVAMLILFVY